MTPYFGLYPAFAFIGVMMVLRLRQYGWEARRAAVTVAVVFFLGIVVLEVQYALNN